MDRSYKQRLTLEFNEPNTEYKYFQETFLLRSSSFKSFQFWVFLILLYYCITTLRPSLSLLLLFSSFLSYFSPIHVKRFFFQVLFWIWKIECLTPNNLMESIGIFLPNIFLNFYLQGQWKWLFVTSTCEAFLLNFITDSSIFYLLLGVFTASTVSAALEKDFRDIWHLYSSSKKSKSMHKSLWENSLSVGFIVDLNLKIIKMNQLGKEICGNSFAPGDQIDSFIGEKKIVTRKLVENAIREENPEDLLIKHNIFTETNTKSTGTLVKSGKFNWNCRNYGILMCVDISTYLCKLKILQKSLKVLQLPTAKALNDFYQSFSKKSRSQSELFSSFNTSQHLFRCMGLLQNIFNAEFTPSAKHFNINAEILNLIELNYLLASKNALEIFYTKEKGIPDSVIGDKCLHNQIMQNILKTVLDNSVVNSEVHILLQVSSLDKNSINLSYTFSFRSAKISNLDIDAMFAKKKIFLSADSVKEVANSIEKYGFEVTSANYILTALKGNIVKVHSEGEFSKATIILNLHFQSGKREIDVPEINICLSKIQETPLTTRWSPGHYASPEIEKTIESDEDFIQVAKGISESFPQWASPVITIRPRVPLRSIIVLGANITEKNVFQEKMIGWVVKFAEDIEEASQVIEKFAKYHAYFSVIFSFLDSEKAFKFLQSIRSIEKSTHYKTFICGLHNPTRPKLYDSISNF